MTYDKVLDVGVVVVSVALVLAVLSFGVLAHAARTGRTRRMTTVLRADVGLLWFPTFVVAAIGPWGILTLFFSLAVLFALAVPVALIVLAEHWGRGTGVVGAAFYGGVGGLALISLGGTEKHPAAAVLQPLCATMCFVIAAIHVAYAVAATRDCQPAGSAQSPQPLSQGKPDGAA